LSLNMTKATEMSGIQFRMARIRSSNRPKALLLAGASLAI
jgi:hypothetical protein